MSLKKIALVGALLPAAFVAPWGHPYSLAITIIAGGLVGKILAEWDNA